MARQRPTPNLFRNYVGPAALALALVLCMPVLGAAAFVLRGIIVATIAVAIAASVTVWVWHLIEPTLGPRARWILRNYALPTAIGVAIVVCLPLLAVLAFVVQGTVAALLATGLVIFAGVEGWRAFILTHRRPSTR